MSTIRVVNVQHTDATEPNIVLESDGTTVFASGITISGGTNLTVSGTAEFASGTASTPGITFIDDNNTGIYEAAADTVAITTSGTERLRVDNLGNVGIGVTNAAQRLVVGSASNTVLRIDNADDSTAKLYFHNSGSTDMDISVTNAEMSFTSGGSNERMRIDSSGRLLLGLTSQTDSNRLTIQANSGSSSGPAYVAFRRGEPLPDGSANGLGYLRFEDAGGNLGAQIRGETEGAWSSGNYPTAINFHTRDSGDGATTERMRIDSSGNIGIGKTSSGNKLEIEGQGDTKVVIDARTDAANGSVATLELWSKNSGGTNNFGFVGYDGDDNFEIGSAGSGDASVSLVFKTNDTERMRVLATGGLTFNGDTAAANALDDYEEGTFTPTLTFATAGTSSFGYTAQTGGRYTKIGRFVHCRIEIRLNSFSKGTASGDLQIDGLPFSATGGGSFGQFIGNFASFQTPLPTAAGNFPIVIVLLNQSKASFKVIINNANWDTFPDPDSNSQYKIDLQYYV